MIVNARMYSVSPAVKAAWRELLGWVLERAGLGGWQLLDWDYPKPLGELWARPDLGCAMMCGLPYSQRRPRPALVAVPLPSPARYAGRPVYFTDFAVRADSQHRTLEDTFGGVIGTTLPESMSGYVAPRVHLLARRKPERPRLYRAMLGGLVSARGVLEALAERRIDVGPLDSYWYDLLRRNEPRAAAAVRVVSSTAAAPIPPLIATAALDAALLERLRAALAAVRAAAELAPLRDVLQLEGFAVPSSGVYDVFDTIVATSAQPVEIW